MTGLGRNLPLPEPLSGPPAAVFARALPIMRDALRSVLAPPLPLVPSRWMAEHLVVPDGPRAGGRWDPSLTPYVAEIVDAFGPDSPHNLGVVRKSAQTGLSVAGIGLVASYVARAPCRIGYALPTLDALQEFNREKLTPAIEQTPELSARIKPQTSRSASGSTTVSKKFPGGSLVLINANSAADLRSKSLKVGIGDEVDEWADDLNGQGDPWDLLRGRFIAFHATADWRLLALSTPTLAAASRIDALYKRGDQRLWHIRCPQCGAEIPLEFKSLTFNRKPPYRAFYAAQCCGRPIEELEKTALIRAGRFVATNAAGLYPSWHVDALISQLTTWQKIAEEFLEAEGQERKLKAFYNLTLGLPYEIRGDAPDYVRLMERREDYPENRIPPLGLLFVGGADVQHSGIWVELVAFAPDRQSWTITARFLPGDTTDPDRGAFALLAKVFDERFEDAYGTRRPIDALAIDAGDGGRANQVYAFARHRHRAFAVKGMPGWNRPAVGTPAKVSITLSGKRVASGANLWPIGTWDLKAEFYSNLRKDGRKAGQELDPPGYCHFGTFLDERFFRQLTAEYLADVKIRGRSSKVWKDTGPNHLLDCRTYALAMAERLGLTRMTRDQWLRLAQRYSTPAGAGDLFAPPPLAVQRDVEGGREESTIVDVVAADRDLNRAVAAKPTTGAVPHGRRVRSRGI